MSKYNSKKYFQNINEYYKKNYLIILTLILTSFIISYFSYKDYLKSLLTIVIITLHSWAGHVLLHKDLSFNWLGKLHISIHHLNKKETILSNFIEFIFINFFVGGGLLLILVCIIRYFKKITILNPYIILFWILSFIVIHISSHNNKYLSKLHHYHHINSKTTYTPEYWDIVFKTKDENQSIYKEYFVLPLIILVSLLICIFINSPIDFLK